MLSQTKNRFVCVVRTFSLSSRSAASHYDVLEITPKASQSEIKSAYYKLSKIYHPDKSSDDESARKFRDITEAYEILGNVQLKNMYDQGLLGAQRDRTRHTTYHAEEMPTDPVLKFYKSREFRTTVPNGKRSQIYNFDDWSRNHYGDLFKKTQYDRKYSQQMREKRQAISEPNHETFFYVLFGICALFTLLVVNGKADYDHNKLTNINKSNENNEKQVLQKPEQDTKK